MRDDHAIGSLANTTSDAQRATHWATHDMQRVTMVLPWGLGNAFISLGDLLQRRSGQWYSFSRCLLYELTDGFHQGFIMWCAHTLEASL